MNTTDVDGYTADDAGDVLLKVIQLNAMDPFFEQTIGSLLMKVKLKYPTISELIKVVSEKNTLWKYIREIEDECYHDTRCADITARHTLLAIRTNHLHEDYRILQSQARNLRRDLIEQITEDYLNNDTNSK